MNFKENNMALICFVFYFLIGYSICFSQDFVLVDANNGLEGGTVNKILYSSNQSLFCGTRSGLYRWSNNIWNKVNNFPLMDVRWLFNDNLDRLFAAGVYTHANPKSVLFRSDNDGNTWIEIPFPNPYFQGVFYDSTKNRTFILSEKNLYCSADNGDTWELFGLEGLSASDIALNSEGHIFAACYGFGIYRSTDDGLTWTVCNTGITDNSVTHLLVNKSGDIYCGNAFGEIYKSLDNGNTWTKSTGIGGSTCFIKRSEKYKSIFAGSLLALYQYTDLEQKWIKFSENNLDYLPFTHIVEHQNEGLLIGTGGAGVIFAPDLNTKWEAMNNGMYCAYINCFTETKSGNILIGMDGMGIFRSNNNGESWLPSDSGYFPGTCKSLAVSNGNIVFAGTNNACIFYSKDEGRTWIWPTHNGPCNYGVYYMAANSLGHIYSTSNDYKLARVKNTDSTTWEWEIVDISNCTEQYTVTNIAINSKDQIFIVLSQTDILRSSDNGNSWQSISAGLPEEPIYNIAFGKRDKHDIYVTHYQGIFKSDSTGTTWNKISGWPEYMPTYGVPLCIDKKERIYLGTSGKLFYKDLAIDTSWKTFQGSSWYSENTALFINSSGYIFVGTLGDGSYRSEKPVSISLPQNLNTNSDNTVLFTNNHSSSMGISVINFSLKKSSNLSVRIIDLLGKEVVLLTNGFYTSGLHSLNFSHEDVSSGLYFIHFQVGASKSLKKITVLK